VVEAFRLALTTEQAMTDDTKPISPLRQRMIEEMTLRKLSEKTHEAYLRAVRNLEAWLQRSPRTATAEDLRRYQLYLVEHGVSPTTINAIITGLRFFFEITLEQPETMAKMSHVKEPHKLREVLSREETAQLLACAGNLKHKAALSVAYGAGLRASEVAHLRVGDVDGQRMCLRVEQGKGQKDRYAQLSPTMLDLLRAYWKQARAKGKVLNDGWLFPGLNPVNPLTPRQLNRAIRYAAAMAGIRKRVSMHSLRHAYATHLLEQGEDVRVIQVMLGHKKLETTQVYTHVATELLRQVVSPLETLPPTH
jgi:site-specific recombinase XerD